MKPSDFDYVGAFLFSANAADPAEMIPELNLDDYPPAPPPVSGYRPADLQGIACWNCGHFTVAGDPDNDGIADGVCELWETQAEGEYTCDRFTAHSDLLRQGPHTSWNEDCNMQNQQDHEQAMRASIAQYDYSDSSVLNEVYFSGTAVEEDDLVWKEILRTGEWSHTPTNKGVIAKKLRIVKEGKTDPAAGVISLSEIYQNFEDKAVPYVTVPLSDDTEDHKNIARVNTGFVKRLKMTERDGNTFLVAGIDFTEPEVKGKVLRGTIPDCSAGIPFGVTRRADNKLFGSVLDHVCLTRRPFVDRLAPFGIAASDGDTEMPVEAWEEEIEVPAQEPAAPTPPQELRSLSYRTQENAIRSAMSNQLQLSVSDYSVVDIEQSPTVCIVKHRAGTQWRVPFRLTGDQENPIVLSGVSHWKTIEEPESENQPPDPAPIAASEIESAHQMRELRFADTTNQGGSSMSTLNLDGVELSESDRARIQSVLDENANLRRSTREADAEKRIAELTELGLKDRPGALKFYRSVMLSDDGGPAIVLFSDSDDENKKERLTALEVLDRFIAAMKGDGGVQFSDQAFQSGNDQKPPANADGERNQPLETRVEEAKTALYGRRRRTGRK